MKTPPSLDELLHGCLNGTLDDAQEQALAGLLRESPEARQALRSYLQIEGGLLSLARAGALAGPAPRLAAGTSDSPAGVVPSPTLAPSPHWLRVFRRVALGVATLAAGVLVLIAGWRWLNPPPVVSPSPPIIARVVEAEGSVDIVTAGGESFPAAVGQPMRAGDSLRTGDGGSAAVLELADTTCLELSPETAVRLPEDGSRGVQLIQGVMRGQEATRAERPPLVVTTAALEVRVEGDRFVVSSASPESLRVEMMAGKAEVVRQRDQKTRVVGAGDAVLVQADLEDMIVGSMPRVVNEPRRVLDFPGAWAVFFEPDNQHLLTASYRELQRFGPGPVPEKTVVSTDKHQGRLAAFSADGNTLAVYRGLSNDDPVILWDVRTKQQVVKVGARITDRRFTLAPDASWLATVDRDDSPPVARVWDGKTGAQRFAVPADLRIEALASSPDSRLLAAGLVDLGKRTRSKVLLVNARTGEQAALLPACAAPITALAFSPDGRYLAVGITGQVQVWDVQAGALARSIRGFERVVTTLTYSPDGTLLAGATQDGQVWLWDTGRGEVVQVIQAGPSGARLLAFTPDGRSLLTGGIKRLPLMIWDVSPCRPAGLLEPERPDTRLVPLRPPMSSINRRAFLARTATLAGGSLLAPFAVRAAEAPRPLKCEAHRRRREGKWSAARSATSPAGWHSSGGPATARRGCGGRWSSAPGA